MPGLYYEDFAVGQQWLSPRRTVTEADIVAFAGVSGDFNPLHTDEEFCRNETPFGGRIAHGALVLSIATGLKFRLGLTEGTLIAFLGMQEWNFKGPVRIGDTVAVRVIIESLRATKHPERGVVVQRVQVINQKGEVVQEGLHNLLMRRRAAG